MELFWHFDFHFCHIAMLPCCHKPSALIHRIKT